MFDPSTRVLVIDDMQTMRKIIRAGLKKIGLKNVIEAEDGYQAWIHLEKNYDFEKIGLIISDWNMPKMSGLDLLKKVRSDERFHDVPFLMVTAESEQSAVLEAVKEKVSNYIVKPFPPDILEEKLILIYKKHNRE